MSTCKTSSEIWEQHNVKLKAFVCSKVNGDDICHDILHDVFLKISERKERITWIEQPTSYVINLAQNAIVDYYRTQMKAAQPLEADYIQATEQLSEIQLADCCLLSFIKALPLKSPKVNIGVNIFIRIRKIYISKRYNKKSLYCSLTNAKKSQDMITLHNGCWISEMTVNPKNWLTRGASIKKQA